MGRGERRREEVMGGGDKWRRYGRSEKGGRGGCEGN
jgi:hypothetical protein